MMIMLMIMIVMIMVVIVVIIVTTIIIITTMILASACNIRHGSELCAIWSYMPPLPPQVRRSTCGPEEPVACLAPRGRGKGGHSTDSGWDHTVY